MLEPLLTKLNNMRVVLASGSKQRQTLLNNARLKCEVCVSDYEETLNPADHTFTQYVEETAANKVKAVFERFGGDDRSRPDLILGFDTMIHYDGRMFGKPKDEDDAACMLRTLTASGLPHYVYTGVAIKFRDRDVVKFTEVTTVYMARLTEEEIRSYVKTGEPIGKAGAYAIQGIGGTFVKRIDGDFNNVVGVPICRLTRKLKEILSTH